LLIVLATSPRVAPGLLSWPAWQALRSAAAVLAPAGHPQLPALDEAGIAYRVVDVTDDANQAFSLDEAAREAAGQNGTAVWLAPPGAAPPVPPGARLLPGSADLPGAHLIDLVATMDRLRRECPWDARQTHASLAPYLLEEPYEALDALESGDQEAFREELGDVLLQVVFHARVAAERADGYTADDVADGIVAKLVNVGVSLPTQRHPVRDGHLLARVSCSGRCLMGAYANIRVGKSAKKLTQYSNVYLLRKRSQKTIRIGLDKPTLRKLRSAVARKESVTATVYGAVVDPSGNIERRSPGRTLHITG